MQDLINKVIQLCKDDDLSYEKINSSLSYGEKQNLFLSNEYAFDALLKKCALSKIKIFKGNDAIKFSTEHFECFQDVSDYEILDIVELPEKNLLDFVAKGISRVRIIPYVSLENKKELIIPLHIISPIVKDFPDSEKHAYIDRRICNYLQMIEIIVSLSSDEEKLKYIRVFNNNSRIICSLKSDELKKKFIKTPIADRGTIIASLSNDQDKEDYLNSHIFNFSNSDKYKIISSFSDIKKVEKYIHLITSESYRANFILYVTLNKEMRYNMFLSLKRSKNISYTYSSIEDIEIRKKKIDSISNQNTLYDTLYYIIDSDLEEDKKYIMSKLNKKVLKKFLLNIIGTINFKFEYLLYVEDVELIYELISHSENMPNYDDKYYPIFEKISYKFNLNLEHLIQLAKIVDCNILRLIENKNIKKTINLDDANFSKYMQIFSKQNMEMDKNTQNNIVNALLQRKFKLEYGYLINLRANTMLAVQSNNREYLYEVLNIVCSEVDIQKYNLTFYDLKDGLINNDEIIISTYQRIIDDLLVHKRNKFVKENINEVIESVTEKKYDIDELIKYFLDIHGVDEFIEILSKITYNDEFRDLTKDKDALKEALEFKNSPKNFQFISEKAKAVLKKLKNINFNKSYFFNYNYAKVKYNNVILETQKNSILEIMSQLDIDMISNTILTNDELFNKLLNYLKTYKLLSCPKRFNPILEDIELDISERTISAFINYFNVLDREIGKKKEDARLSGRKEIVTITSVLDMSNTYDSSANIYSYLLGMDDYKIIKENPEPYSGSLSVNERLNMAVELLKKIHTRKYITIPPMDENIKLSNGKVINVLIGNTNDTINLTYGERTKSCMRMGGAGETLFKVCLADENFFHISFNDPITGKLISRVSGFRNGNTVFLNQLRNSLVEEYKNYDLMNIVKIVSKKLIEYTKASKYPINNVVISNGYAYCVDRADEKNLNVKDIKRTLPDFYFDLRSSGIVVATSKTDNSLVPIELGKNNALRYDVIRNKVKVFNNEMAKNAVGHILALDQLLSGKSLAEITVQIPDSVLAYMGEDWYVAINYNGEISAHIMINSKDKNKAKEEVNQCLSYVQENIKNIMKEDTLNSIVK